MKISLSGMCVDMLKLNNVLFSHLNLKQGRLKSVLRQLVFVVRTCTPITEKMPAEYPLLFLDTKLPELRFQENTWGGVWCSTHLFVAKFVLIADPDEVTFVLTENLSS